jgi:hypothetical protein
VSAFPKRGRGGEAGTPGESHCACREGGASTRRNAAPRAPCCYQLCTLQWPCLLGRSVVPAHPQHVGSAHRQRLSSQLCGVNSAAQYLSGRKTTQEDIAKAKGVRYPFGSSCLLPKSDSVHCLQAMTCCFSCFQGHLWVRSNFIFIFCWRYMSSN